MNESLNICLSCGICCDGTVIGFVELDQEEIPALKKLMQVEDMNETGFFLEPCTNLRDCSCKIYSNRPKQCTQFNCTLLKSVENGEITFNSASEAVQLIKQRKTAIIEKLDSLQFQLKSQSFYFQILELKKVLEKSTPESLLSPDHRELLVEINELSTLLSDNIGLPLE